MPLDPHLAGLARIFHADPIRTAENLLRVRDNRAATTA